MSTGHERLEDAIESFVYTRPTPNERIHQDRRLVDALTAIVDERARQEAIGVAKRSDGIDWRSCADPDMDGGDFARYTVLGEEVGEVANASLERGYALAADLRDAYERALRGELVQVAAVAVAWIEAIDARSAA